MGLTIPLDKNKPTTGELTIYPRISLINEELYFDDNGFVSGFEGSEKSDLRGRRANWALPALRGLFPTMRRITGLRIEIPANRNPYRLIEMEALPCCLL